MKRTAPSKGLFGLLLLGVVGLAILTGGCKRENAPAPDLANKPEILERSKDMGGGLMLRWRVMAASATVEPQWTEMLRQTGFWLGDLDPKGQGELGRLNRSAGLEPVVLRDDVFTLLGDIQRLCVWVDGHFDPLAGAYRALWGMTRDAPRVPKPDELSAVKESTGWMSLVLDEATHRAFLPVSGMIYDLGPVMDAVLARELGRKLDAAGFTDYMLSLGHATIVRGRVAESMKLSLIHPRKTVLRYADMRVNGAAMILNDVEPGFVDNSFRVHPMLDPETGIPSQRLMASAVTGPDVLTAAVLAYVAFVVGPDDAGALFERFPGYAGAMMDRIQRVSLTSGAEEFIEVGEKNEKKRN